MGHRFSVYQGDTITVSFFERSIDYNPAFYLYIGKPSTTEDKLQDGIILQKEIQNTIQSIEVTKEANKTAQMSMSFAYGVEDKLLPIPWINSATIPPGTEARKVVLNARYLNLANKSILLVRQKTELVTRTDSMLDATGLAAVGKPSKVLRKTIERVGKEIKFYQGFIKDEVTVFNGILSRPTGSGNADSIIRIQANAQSSLRLWGGNPLRPRIPSDTSVKDLNDTPSSSEKIEVKPGESLSVLKIIEKNLIASFSVTPENLTTDDNKPRKTYLMPAPNKFRFDLTELEKVSRTGKEVVVSKTEGRATQDTKGYLPAVETPLSYLKKLCSAYNLDYTYRFLTGGMEEVVVYARESSFLANIDITEADIKNNDEYAIYLAYGLGVISFNWSASTFTTSSGGSAVLQEGKDKQLAIGYVDANGIQYETTIDQDKIKEWIKAYGGPAGDDMKSFELAIEFARSNADAFIAYFVDIPANTPKVTTKQVGYGQSGITLSLDLKWAIPGLSPGTLIYFDSANPDLLVLPELWVGVYKINTVKDKFNPKENIWTQTIECIR